MDSAGTMTDITCPYCGKIAARVVIADNVDMEISQTDIALSIPIGDYPWPARIHNSFKYFRRLEDIDGDCKYVDSPIKTFGDLCSVRGYELMRLPNFGRTSLAQVKQVLASHGLQLAER